VPLVMKESSYNSTPPYGPYGLYRASVPVQGCPLPYHVQKFFTPLCKVGPSLNLLTGNLCFFSHFYKQLYYRISRKFDDRFSC